MKIIIYSMNFYPEMVGIGKYSGELSESLIVSGHKVRVICANSYFPEWEVKKNKYSIEKKGETKIFRCPLWVPKNPNTFKRIIHILSFAITSFPIIISQIVWKPNLIINIVPSIFTSPGALFLSFLCGNKTKSWLHIQDFELDIAFKLNFIKGKIFHKILVNFELLIFKGFNKISSISRSMTYKLKYKGIEPEKIFLMPNWIDIKEKVAPKSNIKNPFRKIFNIKDNQVVVMYSGSFNQKQGIDILIESIKNLINVREITWILAGEGPSKKLIEKQLSCFDNIIISPLQPTEKLNTWLSLADIHILPQKKGAENLVMPSKLIGMLASGKAIVGNSSSNTEMAEIIEKVGIRCEPGSAKELSDAIYKLVKNKNLREDLGSNGPKIAFDNFDKNSILKRFDQEIKKM